MGMFFESARVWAGGKVSANYCLRSEIHAGTRIEISGRNDYQIHRVDARIHPENIASITLATKLGFRPLQFEPQSANILGHYVDLMRYTKLL